VDDLVAVNPRVRVEFQDAAPQAADPALRTAKPAGLTDTAIAGWIERLGGRSSLEAGKIRSIDLSRTPASDAQLAYLAGLTALRKLRLDTTEIGDGGMAHVGKLKMLEDLDLTNTMVSDAGLAQLSGLGKLQRLTLNHTLSRGCCRRRCRLKSWRLPTRRLMTSSAAALAAMPTLRALRLAYTDITEAGLRALSALPLRKLDIVSNDLGDEAMVHIGKMTTLEELYLSYCRHTNKGLAELKGLVNLRVFESVRSRLDDAAVPHLNQFPKLRRLNLDYTGLSDAGLKALQLPELEELLLDTANLTDGAVETIVKMPKLRSLGIYHTLITEAAFNKLKAARPGLHVLFDRESSIPIRRKS
jgi:Leucine-rich repeat (LRR) protein